MVVVFDFELKLATRHGFAEYQHFVGTIRWIFSILFARQSCPLSAVAEPEVDVRVISSAMTLDEIVATLHLNGQQPGIANSNGNAEEQQQLQHAHYRNEWFLIV
jgi:hypothetical protein